LASIFAYGAVTLYRRPFQIVPLISANRIQVLQPRPRNLVRFGLIRFRSPLLTESRLISFPPGTEMFQFPGLAPLRVTHIMRRVSPFGHLRIIACLPAPRSFSQAPASFIASCCQGIHHVPFVAINH
jgi:hypothetical protein